MEMYLKKTMFSPYTKYKNNLIVSLLCKINAPSIIDIGCNVNPLLKDEHSLRYLAEKYNIEYFGLDINSDYFDPTYAKSLGINPGRIYQDVKGKVGNIKNLPFKDNSINYAVCADVLEHIDKPTSALKEMRRILTKKGRLVLVIPSLYKLDALRLKYINDKRASTHINKLPLNKWQTFLEKSGFRINPELSKPLGIASGLTYLSWLSPSFVPIKKSATNKERLNKYSKSHKKAKKIITKLDNKIDYFLLKNNQYMEEIVQLIKKGKIKEVYKNIHNLIVEKFSTGLSMNEIKSLNQFYNLFCYSKVSKKAERKLVTLITKIKNPTLILGNSIILTLEKIN